MTRRIPFAIVPGSPFYGNRRRRVGRILPLRLPDREGIAVARGGRRRPGRERRTLRLQRRELPARLPWFRQLLDARRGSVIRQTEPGLTAIAPGRPLFGTPPRLGGSLPLETPCRGTPSG